MNESFAVQYSENGSPESCNCDEPAYVGDGCFVAMTGFIKGISPDPTANFLKLAGDSTCAPSVVEESSASAIAVQQSDQFESVADAAIQYTYIADHALIAANQPEGADCDYWRAEDLGKKVDDVCCDPTQWGAGAKASTVPPDARTAPGDMSGDTFTCYVRERNAPNQGTYIRNFFGCDDGVIQAREGCAPSGTSMGHGYPMNESFAVQYSENGSPESCNCDEPAYVGDGCFVAMTGFIKGISPDPTANFLKLAGDSTCAPSVVEESSASAIAVQESVKVESGAEAAIQYTYIA